MKDAEGYVQKDMIPADYGRPRGSTSAPWCARLSYNHESKAQ